MCISYMFHLQLFVPVPDKLIQNSLWEGGCILGSTQTQPNHPVNLSFCVHMYKIQL